MESRKRTVREPMVSVFMAVQVDMRFKYSMPFMPASAESITPDISMLP